MLSLQFILGVRDELAEIHTHSGSSLRPLDAVFAHKAVSHQTCLKVKMSVLVS